MSDIVERLRGGKCPQCNGWGEVAHLGELVKCSCRGRYEAPVSMDARTEAADEIQSLRQRVERLEVENKSLRRELGDERYMREAYHQMLGPKARQVAKLWKDSGLVRIHTSWSVDPFLMTGEEVAEVHLAFDAAPKQRIDDVDAALSPKVQEGE